MVFIFIPKLLRPEGILYCITGLLGGGETGKGGENGGNGKLGDGGERGVGGGDFGGFIGGNGGGGGGFFKFLLLMNVSDVETASEARFKPIVFNTFVTICVESIFIKCSVSAIFRTARMSTVTTTVFTIEDDSLRLSTVSQTISTFIASLSTVSERVSKSFTTSFLNSLTTSTFDKQLSVSMMLSNPKTIAGLRSEFGAIGGAGVSTGGRPGFNGINGG